MQSNLLSHLGEAIQNAWRHGAEGGAPWSEVAGAASHLAEEASSTLGHQLRKWGKTVGEQDVLGLGSVAAFAASKSLDRAGEYLEREGLGEALKAIGKQIKQHPLPFVVGALSAGWMLGRALPSATPPAPRTQKSRARVNA